MLNIGKNSCHLDNEDNINSVQYFKKENLKRMMRCENHVVNNQF